MHIIKIAHHIFFSFMNNYKCKRGRTWNIIVVGEREGDVLAHSLCYHCVSCAGRGGISNSSRRSIRRRNNIYSYKFLKEKNVKILDRNTFTTLFTMFNWNDLIVLLRKKYYKIIYFSFWSLATRNTINRFIQLDSQLDISR